MRRMIGKIIQQKGSLSQNSCCFAVLCTMKKKGMVGNTTYLRLIDLIDWRIHFANFRDEDMKPRDEGKGKGWDDRYGRRR